MQEKQGKEISSDTIKKSTKGAKPRERIYTPTSSSFFKALPASVPSSPPFRGLPGFISPFPPAASPPWS